MEKRRILLTGATGFLGGELLRRLLERDPRRIVCLVRAASDDEAVERGRRTHRDILGREPIGIERARVEWLRGDMELPGFGLSPDRYVALASTVDEIFHSRWARPLPCRPTYAGRFRADLFYRLHVLPVRVPSLEERRVDVAPLARYFCEGACGRHQLPRVTLSAAAVRALEAAEWPGNVRELAHAVEAACIRAAGERSARVERRHVFPEDGLADEDDGESLTFQEATRRFQRDYLRQALEDTGWNVAETARRLDLSRSHLYNLVNAFGLRRSEG